MKKAYQEHCYPPVNLKNIKRYKCYITISKSSNKFARQIVIGKCTGKSHGPSVKWSLRSENATSFR